MKYVKAIDVYAYGQAIRDGQIKLQSGQWIRLGEDGQLSRFDRASKRHIQAFHGPTPGVATEKYLEFRREFNKANSFLRERIARKAKAQHQLTLPL